MAEQDFDINIRTVADLTGARKASDAIAILNAQAKQSQAAAAVGKDGAGEGGLEEAGARIEHGFSRIAFHAIGAGLVFGAIEQIKKLAEEISKVTESLEKQGEQLVKNAQLYAEQARSAQSTSDVLKIGEEALKSVESTHEHVLELQNKELSIWEKIIDSFSTAIPGTQGALTTVLKAQQEQQAQQEAAARRNLVNAIELGKAYEAAFDRRKAQPINDVVLELTKHVADLENQLKGIDFKKFPESWIATEKNIELAKKQLLEFIEIQKRGETGGPGGTSIIQPAAPPRTVAEFRDDFAKATADFNKQFGPQAIQDFRNQQQKATDEFTGKTPRFGGSSANDILTTLKDQVTLMKQQIDLWK